MRDLTFPETWLSATRALLPDAADWEAFLASFRQLPDRGLLINRARAGAAAWADPARLGTRLGCALTPVPWAPGGFRCPPDCRVSQHVYYEAGCFYLQDPSAMLPAAVLGAQPGERILDLCAAPGGKTAGIAAGMAGRGILVSNEIHPQRSRILVHNAEQLGLSNCVVLNESPERLVPVFSEWFDRILVDAPCSGEGLFRRQPSAVGNWLRHGPDTCVPLQRDILDAAWRMLRPGGVLVYSTCTFALRENEAQAEAFLTRHADAAIEPAHRCLPAGAALSSGVGTPHALDMIRIWPHRDGGDGHFCARFRKESDGPAPDMARGAADRCSETGAADRCSASDADRTDPPPALADFIKKYGRPDWRNGGLMAASPIFRVHGAGHVNAVPRGLPGGAENLRRVKPGLYFGQIIGKGRRTVFQPAHALLPGLHPAAFRYRVMLESDDPLIEMYLKGLTIPLPAVCADMPDGAWCVVCADGLPLGWGRLIGGVIRNKRPRSRLRIDG